MFGDPEWEFNLLDRLRCINLSSHSMGLTCPSCKVAFHPQFFHQLVGFKKRKFDSVYVYYQLCPKCEEPIIGYKEIKSGEFPALVDHESVLLMTRQK